MAFGARRFARAQQRRLDQQRLESQQRREQQQATMAPPPTLSLDQATQQAQQMLNPLFDRQLQQNMQAVQGDLMRRGFFGQAPGAAIERSTAADVEAARAASTADLGQQMHFQSQQLAIPFHQMNQQMAMHQGNLGLQRQALAQQGQQANLSNMLQFAALTDQVPSGLQQAFGGGGPGAFGSGGLQPTLTAGQGIRGGGLPPMTANARRGLTMLGFNTQF